VEDEEKSTEEAIAASRPISDAAWAHATSRWISECINNSPMSQSTEAWNHLGVALPHLRRILEEELQRGI